MKQASLFAGCVCLLSVAVSFAQSPAPTAPNRSVPAPAAKSVEKAAPKTPALTERQQYGMKLLEIAEADAGSLEGAMRSFALLQVARGYQRSDRARMLALLESALTATRELPDDEIGRNQAADLQEAILDEVVKADPQRVDELLDTVQPRARTAALSSLLSYYERNKQQDRALEVIYRIGQDSEIPYGPAIRLMEKMTPQQGADFQRLFDTSLASYRDHGPHRSMSVGGGDFGGMVVRFWDRVPRETVRQAIDELLKDAEEGDKKQAGKSTFSLASDKGSLSFNSQYQYRLFQLLPALREIDETAAESLLKKYTEVAGMLAQYPEGTNTFNGRTQQSATMTQTPGEVGMSAGTRAGGSGSGGGTPMAVFGTPDTLSARVQELSRAQKLVADSEQHPQDALASVSTLSEGMMRCNALSGIARTNVKKNSAVARTALERLLAEVDKVEPAHQRPQFILTAFNLYQQMIDEDSAKKVVERGLSTADKLYAADSNADDPNKALKAFWPSTNAYRDFLRAAGKISPLWAMGILKEIKDPEVRAAAESALAQEWLDIPRGRMMVQVSRGNRTETMIMD